MSRRGPLRGWIWGIADQALASLINLLVGVAVARAVSPKEFGAFALAITVYWLALGANRALASETYTVRYGARTDPAPLELRAAAGVSVGLGALVGVGCLGTGLLVNGALHTSLVALAPMLPLLLVQDFVRSASFVSRRPIVAFMTDAGWLAAFATAWAILAATDQASLGMLTLAWGLAAGVAAAGGLLRLGVLPRVEKAPGWLFRHRDIVPSFLLEYMTLTLSIQLSLVAVGAISGLSAVAAMRGAQLLFGPWQVLLMGTGLVALPEATRVLRERGASMLLRLCAVVGGGLVVASAGWAILLSILPGSVGTQLVGASWGGAEPLILLTGLSLATTSAIAGATLGLRALAAVQRSVPARLATSVMVLGGASAGAWLDSARGALIGISAAGVVAAGVWWWQVWLACVAHGAEGSPPPPVALLGRTR